MEEKGAWGEATVLCSTWAPQACQRQMPQSNPSGEANSPRIGIDEVVADDSAVVVHIAAPGAGAGVVP